MKNLTLAIEDEILIEARKRALDRGTTVNQMVRTFLKDLVTERDLRNQARDRLRRSLEETRVSASPRSWSRDDLYER